MMKSYSELTKLKSFEERFDYLCLDGVVGKETFGGGRYLNQALYRSPEWRSFRNRIIVRDDGCDLGIEGRDIEHSRILIHHINPLTREDLLNRSPKIFDPENVIAVSHNTHQAIHYSDKSLVFTEFKERAPHDQCPWRK